MAARLRLVKENREQRTGKLAEVLLVRSWGVVHWLRCAKLVTPGELLRSDSGRNGPKRQGPRQQRSLSICMHLSSMPTAQLSRLGHFTECVYGCRHTNLPEHSNCVLTQNLRPFPGLRLPQAPCAVLRNCLLETSLRGGFLLGPPIAPVEKPCYRVDAGVFVKAAGRGSGIAFFRCVYHPAHTNFPQPNCLHPSLSHLKK